jgi:hypothetical protein
LKRTHATPGHLAGRRFRPLAVAGALASVVVTAACGHRTDFDIDGPNHRINYFIAEKSMHMRSQEYYQKFIEQELGANFTVDDFVRYMDRSGAVCEQDPDNKITYCMYSTFGWMIDYDHPLTSEVEVAGLWCFWSIPKAAPPLRQLRQSCAVFSPRDRRPRLAGLYPLSPAALLSRAASRNRDT